MATPLSQARTLVAQLPAGPSFPTRVVYALASAHLAMHPSLDLVRFFFPFPLSSVPRATLRMHVS
jgi:hypothetical protein